MSLNSSLKPPAYPGLLSVPRLTTLFASLLVALSAGTNYVGIHHKFELIC
jgi:hypothetical protein